MSTTTDKKRTNDSVRFYNRILPSNLKLGGYSEWNGVILKFGRYFEHIVDVKPTFELLQNPKIKSGKKIQGDFPQSCPQCTKICKSPKQLRKHLRCHKEKVHKCDMCPRLFSYLYMVSVHKKQCHTPKDEMETSFSICKICGNTFKTTYLRTHMKIHTQDYNHKCDKCGKGYLCPSTLMRHIQIEHEGLRFNCAHCDKVFKDEKCYHQHLLIHKSEIKSNDSNNMEVSEKEEQHPCDLCNAVFPSQKSFKLHRKNHKKRRVCELCGKVLSTEDSYKSHMRIHRGERPFTCDFCEKGFPNKTRLQIHKRIHTKEKPYACEVCEKRFNQVGTLKMHKRRHTGDRPFECDICKKQFITKTLLRYHLRTPHKCI